MIFLSFYFSVRFLRSSQWISLRKLQPVCREFQSWFTVT